MTMLLRTLVIAAAVAAAFVDTAMAANYVVGAPTGGWDLNTQLQSWANAKKFFVGDTLNFVYGPSHSLLQVSKPDYDACLTNASIASYSGGNTAITLSSSGNSYYICGTSGHCDRGMKVVISVLPAPAPPTAAPSVPPPAATPSSPTPATPSGSPTSSPTGSPAASPPKPAAPANSPKLSPSVSPSKSPASSPSKSPAISPASSPPPSPTPAAESPAASPPSPNATSPSGSPPPSSANKVNVVSFTMTVGFIIMMLLTL
ncbi:early nodulin-like protein 2 [Coffea eugenioides]|uniref:Uncharacterized protein isoform X1 n=2 Tax=Coffea arabica TaxID=13443 RepID=A0A6P6S8Q3_COFAR|nr:early nodulin-like protein 2 [Coffea eugenioides]